MVRIILGVCLALAGSGVATTGVADLMFSVKHFGIGDIVHFIVALGGYRVILKGKELIESAIIPRMDEGEL